METAATTGTIIKHFMVDFQRGVYGNEWQGTELRRGTVTSRRVAFRRKFTLAAPPEHGAIRFLGHKPRKATSAMCLWRYAPARQFLPLLLLLVGLVQQRRGQGVHA